MIYKAYGISIESQIRLPELLELADADAQPTESRVNIKLGEIPAKLDSILEQNEFYQISENECIVSVPGVARFRIENGDDITVQPRENADEAEIRTYLLGTVFSCLLHQRKKLPMHVSSIAVNSRAIAFTGESGAGKSTIASLLHRRAGYPLICDDVGVFSVNRGKPMIVGGVHRLRLTETIASDYRFINEGATEAWQHAEKRSIVYPQAFTDAEYTIGALVLLERGRGFHLEEVFGLKKLSLIRGAIFRPFFEKCFNDQELVFKSLAAMSDKLSVFVFSRPWDAANITPSVDYLLATNLFDD